MNYDEAPSWLQAANQHAVASDNTSLFDDVTISLGNAPRFIGVSLASGLNSFYNTGVAIGNVFTSEDNAFEYNDTQEWISSYDEDLGKYYAENKSAADITGFVATSLIPGLGGVKGLNAAQGAARAAAAGRVGSNFAKATNLLAPAMETYVKREAAELAAKQTAFSFMHANSLKSLASGATQGLLEGVAFETAVLATMFKSPVLEDMDFGDMVSNAMTWSLVGGGLGGVGAAARTYFGVGKLLKGADLRAKPFSELTSTVQSRELLPSDTAVLAAQDIQRLEKMVPTSEYVLAQKMAAGETGESLLPHVVEREVAAIERLRSNAILEAQYLYRTVIRGMSEVDALGNLMVDLTNKMGADDTMRLMFQSTEIVRGGTKTKLEKVAQELVKQGEAKNMKAALKQLSTEDMNMHVVLHSGNIGEQIVGKPGYLRIADHLKPEQIERLMLKNSFKPSSKMDFRAKMNPRDAEIRWMTARRSTIPFPKGYVFGSHDLPALEKAIRLGMDEIVVDFGEGATKLVPETKAVSKGLSDTDVMGSEFMNTLLRKRFAHIKSYYKIPDEIDVQKMLVTDGAKIGEWDKWANAANIESALLSVKKTMKNVLDWAKKNPGAWNKAVQEGAHVDAFDPLKILRGFEGETMVAAAVTKPTKQTRTFYGSKEIEDYLKLAKTEVMQAQIGHKVNTGAIEAITDIRNAFIEGTVKG